MDDSFTITLTTPEILCATAMLGLVGITLPGQSCVANDERDLTRMIQQGRQMLQHRNLLRPHTAAQWQLHSLLAALIHWLAVPDYSLDLEIQPRSGPSRRLYVYFRQGDPLWVAQADGAYQLTLYQQPNIWITHLANWAGWHKYYKEQTASRAFQLSLAQLDALLSLTWENRRVAVQVLQRTGLSATVSVQMAKLLADVTNRATVSLAAWQGVTVVHVEQLFLLWSEEMLWATPILPAETEVAMLAPKTAESLAELWQTWSDNQPKL